MTELANVSFQEAKKCPRCGEYGEETLAQPGPHRSKIHVITCRNEGCRWYETGWMVQVNEDGTIPQRESGPRGHDKDFAPRSPEQLAAAERFFEELSRQEKRGR